MPNSLSSTGLQTATRAELLAFFQASLQTIYGSDINVESSTPDGQEINIFIQAILDLEDLLTQINNSFDPDNAIGVILDQRVAINGIQRQGGTYTTTNVTIVTSQSVNLYGLDQSVQPVFTVADNAGNQWELIATVLGVSVGTHVYLFRAANPGQVLTVPNTITVPATIVLGVTSINNPTVYSTLGVNEESDMALKIRRQKSVSLASQGYFQGLTAALENIPGITSAIIHENDTSGVDFSGTPGHSIWVIISGTPNLPLSVAYNALTTYSYGQIASSSGINYISVANNNTGNAVTNASFWQVYNPIAEAIYNYRNAGCGMYNSGDSGAQSYTIIQIDGSSFPVYWDQVVTQALFAKMNTVSLDGINAPNISAIRTYLAANFILSVDQEVNINALSSAVQIADPNTLALYPSGFGFSTSSAGTYTYALSPTALNNQFSLSGPNIIILPMVLSCPGGVIQFTNNVVSGTTVSVVSGGNTIQFTADGGYGGQTFSKTGSGTVSVTGLYTSGSAGTDTVTVTDSLGNNMTATISVA